MQSLRQVLGLVLTCVAPCSLAHAQAEVGTNDFRIGVHGPDGDSTYNTGLPAVAYAPARNEYLVVWSGDHDQDGVVDEEREIFGQRLDATSGSAIGVTFRISNAGPDGDPSIDANSPGVAYNSTDDEYLVVWNSNDAVLGDGTVEMYGQRLDGAGTAIGTDFRISAMGPEGQTVYGTGAGDVVFNPVQNEYFVVW